MVRNENWRTDPDIQACKVIVQRHDALAALVIYVDKKGTIFGSSYGINRRVCDEAGEWLAAAVSAIEKEYE